MTGQKVEQLVSLTLNDDFKTWVHPYTGTLLYYKNDSKITVHSNIALVDQLPPDVILELPFGKISSIAFHTKFFIVGFDSGEVVIIDNSTYNIHDLNKNFKKLIENLSISPSGDYSLVYTEEKKLFVLDIQKEKTIKEYKIKNGLLTDLTWLTDSKFIYVTDTGSIHYWDQSKGKEIKVIENAHNSKITTLSKHPRNMFTVITGDSLGEIKIWDLDENKIYPDLINSFMESQSEITIIRSSPRGDLVLTGDSKGIIRIIDMRNPRGEKLLLFLTTGDSIMNLVPSYQEGEFITVFENGSIKLFQGFSIDQIMIEFQNFQIELDSFTKKVEQLPKWLVDDDLDVILPNEIPLIEKNLDIAKKMLSPSLLDKISTSYWIKENLQKAFKKQLKIEEEIQLKIEKTRDIIQKKKTELEQSSEFSKTLLEDLISYLENMKPGKISIDQISLYFNTKPDIIFPLLQQIEQQKFANGSLKSEYSGYFFEITANKSDEDIKNTETKDLNIITCYNCGTDYSIERKSCPNCKADGILCESCSKFIQQRQMIITCPHCKSYFHLACFESKVKLFGRCPKCREAVDFDALIRKSVNEQKQQDQIVSGLSKLLSKKSKFVKNVENEDPDDALFDF